MRGRALPCALTALLLSLVLVQPAGAKYRGTDVLANISPTSQLPVPLSPYPPNHYALDTHVDTGLSNPGGFVGLVPHVLASQLWDVTRFLVLTTISLFTWAFSLDLLNGTAGAPGALGPVAEAISSTYAHTVGQVWLVAGITAAGLWGVWKALVQRRVGEATGQLALSVGFVVLALFLVQSPRQTIGRLSGWTNDLSLAFLSGTTNGSLDGGAAAKNVVARRLFRTLVYEPWVVLDFGGLRHCVDAASRPVSPFAPEQRLCLDHLAAHDGRGGYAERFLRYAPGSGPRNAEYEAIRDGRLPTASSGLLSGVLPAPPALPSPLVNPISGADGSATAEPGQFAGYRVDEADAPAVDIQQEGGGFQRLTLAGVVFVGDLGAVLLLGALSLTVVLAQIFALLLLAFSPVALVVATVPGRGHDLFRGWLMRLLGALLRKAVYSLVLAVVLTVSAALLAAASQLGWLYSFGLQGAFYWGVFLRRHAPAAGLERAGWPAPRARAGSLPGVRTAARRAGRTLRGRVATTVRTGPLRADGDGGTSRARESFRLAPESASERSPDRASEPAGRPGASHASAGESAVADNQPNEDGQGNRGEGGQRH